MKKKVLIADADEQFRNELAAALEAHGELKVTGMAADGEEAINYARNDPPDIIILDLLLPQYDGLSVLDCIAAQRPGITALVVTCFISNYIMDALAARHISGLLKKPCTAQCVVDRIREELSLQ